MSKLPSRFVKITWNKSDGQMVTVIADCLSEFLLTHLREICTANWTVYVEECYEIISVLFWRFNFAIPSSPFILRAQAAYPRAAHIAHPVITWAHREYLHIPKAHDASVLWTFRFLSFCHRARLDITSIWWNALAKALVGWVTIVNLMRDAGALLILHTFLFLLIGRGKKIEVYSEIVYIFSRYITH